MDVEQQDILVETALSSAPAWDSASETGDTKVSELQKEIDALKIISGAQQLRIQKFGKNSTGHARTTACSGKIFKKKNYWILLTMRAMWET